MKLREMFIPYITVGTILACLVLFFFGDDRARAFIVTYTIGYAAVMVVLSVTEES